MMMEWKIVEILKTLLEQIKTPFLKQQPFFYCAKSKEKQYKQNVSSAYIDFRMHDCDVRSLSNDI